MSLSSQTMFLVATRAQNTPPSEKQPYSDGLVRSPAGVFRSQRTTACQSFFSRSSFSSSLWVSLDAVTSSTHASARAMGTQRNASRDRGSFSIARAAGLPSTQETCGRTMVCPLQWRGSGTRKRGAPVSWGMRNSSASSNRFMIDDKKREGESDELSETNEHSYLREHALEHLETNVVDPVWILPESETSTVG